LLALAAALAEAAGVRSMSATPKQAVSSPARKLAAHLNRSHAQTSKVHSCHLDCIDQVRLKSKENEPN